MLVKDVAESQISILEVNFTPDYLDNVLKLRDTWLAFLIILAIIAIIILLILIALRQRIQVRNFFKNPDEAHCFEQLELERLVGWLLECPFLEGFFLEGLISETQFAKARFKAGALN